MGHAMGRSKAKSQILTQPSMVMDHRQPVFLHNYNSSAIFQIAEKPHHFSFNYTNWLNPKQITTGYPVIYPAATSLTNGAGLL